jgi:hypothetical protein
MQSGEIWLLVNELVDGRLSAKWVFRNIAQEYSAPEKSDIFALQGMTDRVIAVPGGWGYSYATQGLGRYGYLNVFTPLSTGDYHGRADACLSRWRRSLCEHIGVERQDNEAVGAQEERERLESTAFWPTRKPRSSSRRWRPRAKIVGRYARVYRRCGSVSAAEPG